MKRNPNVIPAIDPGSFDHISDAALDAIQLLAETGQRQCYIVFNELPIPVTREDGIDSIVDKYDRLRVSHHYAGNCALRDRS